MTIHFLGIWLILFSQFLIVYLNPSNDCKGKPNTYEIYTKSPTFLKEIENAKLYTVGNPQNNASWLILHLYGDSDYIMGKAYGEILADIIKKDFTKYENFFTEFLESILHKFPKFLREMIEKYGIWYALDYFHLLTEKFNPKYFAEFIKGMSETSGLSALKITRITSITQMVMHFQDKSCTVFGCWGEATPDGKLIHIRTLDEDAKSVKDIFPMMNSPLITVHHYKDSYPVATIATVGYLGCMTCFSENLSFGNKIWLDKSMSWIPMDGILANYHTFDGMRYSKNMEEFLRKMFNAKRTISMYVGIGDGRNTEFRALKYAAKSLEVFNWNNQSYYPQHPLVKKSVYFDKGSQPSHDYCFSKLLDQYYGNLTAENFIRYIMPIYETGDVLTTVYDYSDDSIYVSWGFNIEGYKKQSVKIDKKSLFKTKLN